MKIIHIVENLDKGAVENWLVRLFLESRKYRPDWEWTFYCISGLPGRLDKSVIEAGGAVISTPVTLSNKLVFIKSLRTTLRKGKFDIIHSHHDYLSGFYLLSTVGIKFKKRILHIHNTDKHLPVGSKKIQDLFLEPFRKIALSLTDHVIGISSATLEHFSPVPALGLKRSVLYYAVNFAPFEENFDRDAFLKENNLPSDAKILLFIGRMYSLKNPSFLIDILFELRKKRDDVYALFVGEGDDKLQVTDKANALKLGNYIRMLGWRNDTAKIMKCSDVFVFPRIEEPKEGLGLVVVEAQAAGLPLFLTSGIVDDAIVIKELYHLHDLKKPEEWAIEIDKVLNSNNRYPQVDYLTQMKQSEFDLEKGTKNLIDIYEQ